MRILLICLFIVSAFSFARAKNSDPNDTYPLVFNESFEDSLLMVKRWGAPTNYSYTGGITGRGIMIENISSSSKLITTAISVDSLKGGAVVIAANIKAENISQPPNSWNGIKVMLKIVLADNTAQYPQVTVPTGTFSWANKSIYVAIPPGAVSATLYLGLENCSGRVWFDDVLLRLIRNPKDYPPARDPGIAIDKYHSEASLRGTMISTTIKESDVQVLGEQWKANLMRWQIGGLSYPLGLLTPGYDSLLEKELVLVDKALPWARQYGLKIVADLHGMSKGCFKSLEAQNKFVETWKLIASRYKNEGQVWAYDLANEPDPREGEWNTPGLLIWEDLAEKAAREIRKIDTDKPIIVESVYGDPMNFSNLRPLDFSIARIIYSAHFYMPHAFTHQTLYDYKTSCVYPGTIEGKYWDKKTLLESLSAVKDFQDKYRVAIFLGEFSAIRWAPQNSAYYYLKDCIELFESYGWDWTYHAFREYDGWSVEHSENQNDHFMTSVPNDRQKLLRSYFEKNVTAIKKERAINTFSLEQNYPNPFNPETKIRFSVPAAEFVNLKVFNLLGEEITTLLSEVKSPGQYEVSFNAHGLSSGIYFYQIKAGQLRLTKKMLLLE